MSLRTLFAPVVPPVRKLAGLSLIFFTGAAGAQDPVTGSWNLNGNGNWSATANWLGGTVPGLSTNPTSGVDDIANFTFNITANRTITIDGGVPGTNVVLGTMNIGDPTGNSSYIFTGGTITFDVSTGEAKLNMQDGGGNITINSALMLNDPLRISISDVSNSQGFSIGGKVSGGTAGSPTIILEDLSVGTSLNYIILNSSAGNDFAGQIQVNSGLVRFDGNNSTTHAGLTGVGNETIAMNGGGIDLRDHDFNVQGDNTEIFRIAGTGPNGLGSLRNTTGTGIVSHVVLDENALIYSQGTIVVERRLNAAGTAGVAPILDLNGHALTKIGVADLIIRGAEVQSTAPLVFNIHEGEIRFEDRGTLTGGGSSWNQLSGATFNLSYNRNPYDNVDLANGSRTTNDAFGVNANQTALQGNSVVQPRLSIGSYWGESVTGTGMVAEQTKVVTSNDNVTINFNNGVFQREGNTDAGRTFDHIFGPGTTINLVGGGIGRDSRGSGNLFDINGGSGVFNASSGAYDHPGATEIKGQIDNTTGGNAGTGFTVRGSRELRLTGNNANFNGDILVKLPTYRWIGPNFSTVNGARESEYTNLSIGGANGTLNQANSITLTRMGSLALLNNSASGSYASANHNDRLNDDGFLNFRNGVLKIETDVSSTNSENLGNVVSDLGTNFMYLDTRAGGGFDGAFESFTRNNGSVLKIINTNKGHAWGTSPGEDRIALINSAGLLTVGANAPGTATQNVVPGLFGGVMPTFSPGTGAGALRSVEAVENAAAFFGVGTGLMTLDNGYLRPLAASEYSAGSSPVADTNWLLNAYVGTATEYTANKNLFAVRNVTSDVSVNSLTIAHDPAASGQAIIVPVTNVDTSKDYIVMDPAATLTIKSGIISFATLVESTNANTTPVIRGGFLNMAGQQAIINSASTWHDLDSNSGTGSSFLVGNSAFIRSHIINANGLVKTGRNNLYLDTWNDITGNVYVSDNNSLVARHHGALGMPAPVGDPRREVVITGTGNLLLEYGVNIKGIDIRATNSFDTTRVVLRNEGTTHSTWTGNVIIDGADGFGAASDASYNITARNNGTLTLYGNVFTDNNQNLTDDDSFADPPLVTTSIGETYTLNLRGQFRDVETGNLGTAYPGITSILRTGDSATRLDANHSLRFQMSGHDEGNVNVFQQWDATGRIDLRQGYFRVQYDPTAPGANGFYTDSARALLAGANEYFTRVVLGADGTSTTANYHSHLMLTQPGQVFNAPFLYSYNDNRQGTQTIGGENETGTVYYGSVDNTLSFSLQYTNQSSERDIRFLQVRGGNMVFNGRLDDENSTLDSFNSVATVVGPGTITFNRNVAGNSDIDRWNFLGGTTHWGFMNGNNQFARAGGTTSVGSKVGFGGGHLVLDAQGTARTQTLDGSIYLMGGAGSITVNQNTTLTLGTTARSLVRSRASTLAFIENGNGAINLSAVGLSTTAGDFFGSWGLYGDSANGITHWAARQGTTGVQAFAGYSNDSFGTGLHTNVTSAAVVAADQNTETLRFDNATSVDIAPGSTLTLNKGGILIPSTVAGDVSINGGNLTSGWTGGDGDLLMHNFGSGRTSVVSVITDNGGSKVNFVHDGSGTTALASDNTFTGDHFFNGGVVEISSESQLGDINGSVARLSRVNNGASNGANMPSGTGFTVSGGGAGAGLQATFQTDSAQAINATTALVSGGSGYTSGVYLNTKADLSGTATVWAILDSGNLHFDGGTLRVTEDINMDGGRTVFLGPNGGALEVADGKTLTINGYITSEFSHAHAGNGYNTINHLGVADEQASNRNPDIGDLIIQGGGTVKITGAPDNAGQRANMYHSYGGITWLNEGVLRINTAGSAGPGVLGTTRSFVDSTIVGSEGTLMLNTVSDMTMHEWFSFRGQGYQDRGTIQTVGTGRIYRFAGQLMLDDALVINNNNGSTIRINESGGAMYGSGDIRRVGNGNLMIYGNSPDWTGSIINGSGDFYMTSAGNLQGMPSLTLERNSIFYYEAGSSIDEFRDRLNDSVSINTDGYIRMRLRPTTGVNSGTEKVGTLNVLAGQVGIEFDLGADLTAQAPRLTGDHAFWHYDSISRSPGTSVHLRSIDAGVEFAHGGFGSTQFADVVGVKVDNLPTMIGSGDGLNGNAPVAQGFFGGTRPLWFNVAGTGNHFPESYVSNSLVTHDTTAAGDTLLRPLMDSEYTVVENPNTALTTSVDLNAQGLSGDKNLKLVGVTTDLGIGNGELTDRRNSLLRLHSSETVNSLTIASDTYASGSATGRGNFTAVTINPGAELVVNSGMIVSANRGVQNRTGFAHSTSVNLDIRNAINGGAVNFAGRDAHINLVDIWAHYSPNESPNAYHATSTNNSLLYLNSSIKNANHLIKTGPVSLYLQSINEYTGDTYINEGLLYARNDYALGNGTTVYVQGGGGFVVSSGANISGKTVNIGTISGNNLGLTLQEGASWRGDVVIGNLGSVGAASFVRAYTPRIYNDSIYRSAIYGNIYGSSDTVSPWGLTDARMFSTYDTGSDGILEFRGSIRDSVTGALTGAIDNNTVTQVMRMEVVSDNNGYNVALYQPHDAAGRIRLLQGILMYQGGGNFYTDNAATTVNSNLMHPMLGFQMGGRSVMSGDGNTVGDNLAFFLANSGSVFNLASWEVGVETYDPENLTGNGNYGLGNTTGNSTLGGLNFSGEITFGTGTGSIFFTQTTNSYNRDLRLFAMPGGELNLQATLVDGGNLVTSSITKIGAGQVNLQGSTSGAGSVEGVNVLGGTLLFENYGANFLRRVGDGASLLLGGGVLAVDGSTAAGPISEDFGSFTINAGGSALAAVGPNALVTVSGVPVRADGGQVHFQSIAGGAIRLTGVAPNSFVGAFATYGASLSEEPSATDWAATDGSGKVIAFAGYTPDSFSAGTHTDVAGTGLVGGATGSIRFNSASGDIGSGSISLGSGGVLITSNYAGGTPMAAGVGLTTDVVGTDLILHNFSPGAVNLAADISGGQGVVFNGTGAFSLTGTNTYTGATYVTGSASVTFDDPSRFGGTSSFILNGGKLNFVPAASGNALINENILLGGNNGIVQVGDAGSRLVLRGTANNQITSEANLIAGYTSNPFSGGLTLLGPGTIQFGDRNAATAATQDLLGLVNDYTGLTVIGDGVTTVRVDLQGQGNDNAQYTPFGTTDSWADGTILTNNSILEFSPKRGDASRDSQIRVREWFQIGRQASDQVMFDGTTQRQPTIDGQLNIIGTLTINARAGGYSDAGGTGNSEFLMNPNEGGIQGSGDIVKLGPGNLRFYQPLREWTGNLDIQGGTAYIQAYQTSWFEETGKIYFGDPAGLSTLALQMRVEMRFGNNSTQIDSGVQNMEISRDIIVRDNIKQAVRIAVGYGPDTTYTFSGNIEVGSGSTGDGGANSPSHVRFYNEDTTGIDGHLVGHSQHSIIALTGNLSGSNNVMLEHNEGGSANDDANDQFTTFLLGGNNIAFTGKVTVGPEQGTGTANFDRDDTEILRFGSDSALTSANNVELRNLSTMQAGGRTVAIGNLTTNDGVSTTGLYSFISPTWAPDRETAADLAPVNASLDGVTGTLHGGSGTLNYTPLGNSSAIIENAASTPGTLKIHQEGVSVWDAYFRDGVPDQRIEPGVTAAGSLSIEKHGLGVATLTIFNSYSGTTKVEAGTLQVGDGGNGNWGFLVQAGGGAATTALGFNRAVGSTGTGATIVNSDGKLTGSGHVRGNLEVHGVLAPGDTHLTQGAGGETGTLFVGNDLGAGNFTLNPGSVLQLQAISATLNDSDLNLGTYTIDMGASYENYIATMLSQYEGTQANPYYFGQDLTGIQAKAQHDHLEIGGNYTWNGGTIQLLESTNFLPNAGDVYNLMDWYGVASWNGFNVGSDRYLIGNGDDSGDLNLPDLSQFDPTLRWDTGLLSGSGVLVIAMVPEPSKALLLLFGLSALLLRRRRGERNR
jgi:autotransporter-associated beta strand protein